MRFLVITLSIAFYANCYCQSASAVVFSEMGEKFTLYLNSEPMNETPKSNIKLTGLTSEFYQARVDFEDASLQDCMTSNFAVQFNSQVTYVVKKNKKGEYLIRFQSQTDGSTASAEKSSGDDEARRFADVDNPGQPQATATNSAQNGGNTSNTSITTTTTTTTTNSAGTSPGNSESINVGMNINGVNMGINMNIPNDDTFGNSSATTVTQQTTTTTHSTTSSSNASVNGNNQVTYTDNSESGCRAPMAASSFSSAKESINSKSFEDSKMTVAKQVTKANCLSCNQIKEVMSLFSFEESKLAYAKYAYDYCYNKTEYYTINDAFTFESSIDELNKYIESK
ncbi:MAG: DUF4476 domain-containing protein [Flavobacteriales bacterium]